MEPRFRGGLVIFARSFARIHETNLKKQGLLPLTFADPGDLRPDRRGRPHQRARPAAGARPARCAARSCKPDGTTIDFEARHTFSDEQVEWFKAGSALNIVRAEGRRRPPPDLTASPPARQQGTMMSMPITKPA